MIIDLSLPIKNDESDPDSPKIVYLNHVEGAKHLISGASAILIKQNLILGLFFKFLSFISSFRIYRKLKLRLPAISFKDFPAAMGLANEELALDTHCGTHLDAPWHFGPEIDGRRSRSIDEVPLEWCYGDGAVLDMRHKKAGELINKGDITEALAKINYELKPFDIVLIMTGADKHFGTREYFSAHPGMSAEATAFLIGSGVKIIGIDAWGFDRPAMKMMADFLASRDSSFIFPAHFVGRRLEYCHIEKLANLDSIPRPFGFKVACFPVKIEKASAGWCRVVAIL